MNVNNNTSKEEIKAFLKIKEQKDSESFIEISPNKTELTLFPNLNSKNPRNTKAEYEFNKIFTEKDEYSYIYEEITRDCFSCLLNGQSYCFLSYGETSGEKHSILFGGSNSHINLTERGLFPRLIESFFSKPGIFISYSIMCVYSNKLIDLSKFSTKEAILCLEQDDLLLSAIDINQTSEIIHQIDKISLKDSNDFISSFELYNLLFSHLYQIEPNSDFKLFSFSDFIYVIYINDQAVSNSNYPLSIITLCELAGNEMKNTKVSNPGFTLKNSIKNTKAVINNTNTVESLKKTIRKFRQVKFINKHKRINNFQVETAKLLIVLQQLCFCSPLTSFMAIGSISLNANMLYSINDTLHFLFDLKKIGIEREASDLTSNANIDNVNKEDLIYNLQAKCKEQEIEIKEMNMLLSFKNEQFEKYKQLYNKQVDKLKSIFAFEGDINVLLGGNEYTKEAKSVQKISNAMANLTHEKNKNEKFAKEIVDLKKKISKLINENEILKSDQSMLSFVHNYKEEKELEAKKMKNSLESANTINKLKEENEKLLMLNKEYKKEIEAKYNVIQKMANISLNKQENILNRDELRSEIQKEMDEKYKEEYRQLQLRYSTERDIINRKNEGHAKGKEEKMSKLSIYCDDLIAKHQKEIDSYTKEMIFLYEFIQLVIASFRKEFGWKYSENLSAIHYSHFITSKENYMKHIEVIETNLNMINFPITIKEYNTKKGDLLKKTFPDELNIAPSLTLKSSIEIKKDEETEQSNLKLLKENIALKKKIKELTESVEVNGVQCSFREKDKLMLKNNQLTKKLEDRLNENQKNKMIISTHERIAEKLTAENIHIRTQLGRKKVTTSLNYSSAMDLLRTRNMKVKHMNKAISLQNVIPPSIFARPKTSSVK